MDWEVFKGIGLSKKQAKVLYALIRLKEAKASEVASAAGVSRVRTYDILDELYRLGVIRKKKGRPTKYIALSPEETVERFLDWKKEKYEQEKKKILERKEEIRKEAVQAQEIDEQERPDNILEFISLGEASERETKKIIADSKGEIKLMSEAFQWLDSVIGELEKTDAEIKVLLQNPDKISERAREAQKEAIEKLEKIGAEVKFVNQMPLRGCITQKEAVLNVKDKESSNLLRDCIYTNHESFIRAMNIYFDTLWEGP